MREDSDPAALDLDPAALDDSEVVDLDPEDTPVDIQAVDTQLDPEVVLEEVTAAGSEGVMEVDMGVDLEGATEVVSDLTAVSVVAVSAAVPAVTD